MDTVFEKLTRVVDSRAKELGVNLNQPSLSAISGYVNLFYLRFLQDASQLAEFEFRSVVQPFDLISASNLSPNIKKMVPEDQYKINGKVMENQVKIHWLAIDGKQPLIKENPFFPENNTYNYNFNINYNLNNLKNGENSFLDAKNTKTDFEIRKLKRNPLGKESLTYLETIMAKIYSHNKKERSQIFSVISRDRGVEPLVPFMVSSFSKSLSKGDFFSVNRTIKALEKLVTSNLKNLSFYIEQIISMIFYLIMRPLKTSIKTDFERELKIKERAALVLSFLSEKQMKLNVKERIRKVIFDFGFRNDFRSLYGVFCILQRIQIGNNPQFKRAFLENVKSMANDITSKVGLFDYDSIEWRCLDICLCIIKNNPKNFILDKKNLKSLNKIYNLVGNRLFKGDSDLFCPFL